MIALSAGRKMKLSSARTWSSNKDRKAGLIESEAKVNVEDNPGR